MSGTGASSRVDLPGSTVSSRDARLRYARPTWRIERQQGNGFEQIRSAGAASSAWSGVITLRAGAFSRSPVGGEWRWQPGSFDHLYAGIGRDFPYAWVFVRAGLSDAAVLCGILGLSILGLAIVPYLAWRASGSIAASLISTAASGWIAFLIGLRHLGDVEALMLAGISFLATALVLGVHSSAGRTLRPGSLLWNAALIGSLALVSLSYLFIAPAASSLFVY